MDGKVIKAAGGLRKTGVAFIRNDGEKPEANVAIKVHRQGEVIEALEIQCTCGKTTLVECHYENQGDEPGVES